MPKMRPATFRRGAFAQPAFDHHGAAGEAKAGKRAQGHPEQRMHEHQVQQHDNAGKRTQHTERAYVTDTRDDRRNEQATGDVADGPSGAQKAEARIAESLDGSTQRKQKAMKAACHEQQCRSGQKGGNGEKMRHDGREVSLDGG